MGIRIWCKATAFLLVSTALLMICTTAISGAQSASEIQSQAQAAYLKKEYVKSAELYLQAYKLDPKQTVSLYNAACSFALAGQKEEAFKALNELVEHGFNAPSSLNDDTDFTSLRSDSRWAGVLAKAEENAKKNPPKPRWSKPYQLVDASADVAALRARLGDAKSAVWLEGDVLNFLVKSSAKAVQLTGGIQEPMKRVAESDLWIFSAKMLGWEKAIVTYAFIEAEVPVVARHKLTVWTGSEAPHRPKEAETLQGQIIERTIHSTALNEDRKIHVYLPPNAPKENLPAVFLADGQGCKTFATVLEPLILAGRVRPCAIVGVESAEYRGDRNAGYDPSLDYRSRDYVPGDDIDRFDKHMVFFTDEVGEYVAKEFGISKKREDRAVTGFSNGGAFSAAVAFRRPDFFGTSMPLSLGIPPTDAKPSQPLPRMLFAAGTLESFSRSTSELYELVKSWGVDTTFDLYVAGHDPAMWELAFAKLMPKVFPSS